MPSGVAIGGPRDRGYRLALDSPDNNINSNTLDLQGQDKIYGAVGEVPSYIWTVPLGRKPKVNSSIESTSFPLRYLQSLSMTLPLRGAFFYPWFVGGDPSFPGAWTQGTTPFTQYHPTRGYYDSSNTATIDAQIADLQYAKFDVAISSWWGVGSREDGVLPTLLSRALGTNFKFCAYYEAEGNTVAGVTGSPDPTSAQITSDLNYLSANYTSHPNYLRVNGKPVIFVYGGPEDGTQGPTGLPSYRWNAANAVANEDWYYVLKVYAGYTTDTFQPPDWHQYGPAAATDQQGAHSFTVSPGFWLASESTPRLVRDPISFGTNVSSMLAASVNWKLITSYNEWGEGHSVESANGASGFNYVGSGWDTYAKGSYLDILSKDGATLPTLDGFQANQGAYDWPNPPRGRIPPITNKYWLYNDPLRDLLNQDTMINRMYDWSLPVKKTNRQYPVLSDNGLNALLTLITGNPFNFIDWKNPKINPYFFNKFAALRTVQQGDDLFFGLAGNPTSDWNMPRGKTPIKLDRIYNDNGLNNLLTLILLSPFYNSDWPNPTKGRAPIRQDRVLTDNGLANLLTVFIQNPFMFYDWTVPTGRKVPLENKTFLEVGLPFLIGADTFFGASGQVHNYDWIVPKGRLNPIQNRIFTLDLSQFLIGQDVIQGAPGEAPDYDWQNPRGRNFPTSLRGSIVDLSQLLIGSDSIYRGSGEVPAYDYPNPKGRPTPAPRGSVLDLSQFLTGQDSLPNRNSLQPNPSPQFKVRESGLVIPTSSLLLAVPFGGSTQKVPDRRPVRRPNNPLNIDQLILSTLIVLSPFSMTSYPNPRVAKKPLFYYVQGNLLMGVTHEFTRRVVQFIPNEFTNVINNLGGFDINLPATTDIGTDFNPNKSNVPGIDFNPDDPGYN